MVLKPIYKFKSKHFYQEFAIVSAIAALSSLTAIRANELVKHDEKVCKNEKLNTIRCAFVKSELYINIELLLITFSASFLTYTLLYWLIGHGFDTP